jgi:hypothetical protein
LRSKAASDVSEKQSSAVQLENLAGLAIDIMAQELSDWRVIFRAKSVHLEF